MNENICLICYPYKSTLIYASCYWTTGKAYNFKDRLELRKTVLYLNMPDSVKKKNMPDTKKNLPEICQLPDWKKICQYKIQSLGEFAEFPWKLQEIRKI